MLTTRDLTTAELYRTSRRRMGLSQVEFTEKYGFALWDYRQIESGKADLGGCGPPLGVLHSNEACFLMRRREGMSRKTLAQLMAVSPTWVTQMERGKGNPERLVKFWSQR